MCTVTLTPEFLNAASQAGLTADNLGEIKQYVGERYLHGAFFYELSGYVMRTLPWKKFKLHYQVHRLTDSVELTGLSPAGTPKGPNVKSLLRNIFERFVSAGLWDEAKDVLEQLKDIDLDSFLRQYDRFAFVAHTPREKESVAGTGFAVGKGFANVPENFSFDANEGERLKKITWTVLTGNGQSRNAFTSSTGQPSKWLSNGRGVSSAAGPNMRKSWTMLSLSHKNSMVFDELDPAEGYSVVCLENISRAHKSHSEKSSWELFLLFEACSLVSDRKSVDVKYEEDFANPDRLGIMLSSGNSGRFGLGMVRGLRKGRTSKNVDRYEDILGEIPFCVLFSSLPNIDKCSSPMLQGIRANEESRSRVLRKALLARCGLDAVSNELGNYKHIFCANSIHSYRGTRVTSRSIRSGRFVASLELATRSRMLASISNGEPCLQRRLESVVPVIPTSRSINFRYHERYAYELS